MERAAKLPFRALLTTGIDDSLVRACQSSQPDIRIYRADQAEGFGAMVGGAMSYGSSAAQMIRRTCCFPRPICGVC